MYESGNTEFGGVAGWKVTSNKSGYTDRSIFLPAAGWLGDTDLYRAGSRGYYWSSSLRTDGPNLARNLYFYSGNYFTSDYRRYGGLSVRPVCP